MNTLRKQILLGLTALSMGAAAVGVQAQAQAPGGRHGQAATTPEQRQANMAEFMAKRQARLHDELKLTSAQEPAWAAFVAAIKPAPLDGKPDRAAWASMTAPARMEKMIALSKERTARMEQHLQALNKFYATLTPEQKKVFDQHTMHAMDERGWGHGMHGMNGGHGMHHEGDKQD
jgi:Spy/CpxP family protein refolding chaperone